eukprot:7354079-Prymnesium_polylepis.1
MHGAFGLKLEAKNTKHAPHEAGEVLRAPRHDLHCPEANLRAVEPRSFRGCTCHAPRRLIYLLHGAIEAALQVLREVEQRDGASLLGIPSASPLQRLAHVVQRRGGRQRHRAAKEDEDA